MELIEKFIKKYIQKCIFHAQNREPAEKNMASHERRDTEESMCEI